MLTFSLSELRRGPHSALLDTGGDGHGLAGGRLSLLADLLLLVRRTIDFAAQSNLAFLGMWIELTRPGLAELLPLDADAGSSSNMVSSQPGRTLGLQSWEIGAGELNFYGVREKRGGRVVDLRIKTMVRVSLSTRIMLGGSSPHMPRQQ